MLECQIIYAILCTSCVLGILEVWGGFNGHSEQPESHFILSSAMGSGGVVPIDVYHLRWVQGRWLFSFQISMKWIAMILSPPLQQPKRHTAAKKSP